MDYNSCSIVFFKTLAYSISFFILCRRYRNDVGDLKGVFSCITYTGQAFASFSLKYENRFSPGTLHRMLNTAIATPPTSPRIYITIRKRMYNCIPMFARSGNIRIDSLNLHTHVWDVYFLDYGQCTMLLLWWEYMLYVCICIISWIASWIGPVTVSHPHRVRANETLTQWQTGKRANVHTRQVYNILRTIWWFPTNANGWMDAVQMWVHQCNLKVDGGCRNLSKYANSQ